MKPSERILEILNELKIKDGKELETGLGFYSATAIAKYLDEIWETDSTCDRYKFNDIFNDYNGLLEVKTPIKVGETILKEGRLLGNNTCSCSINFYLYKNLDIAGREKDGIINILGFYRNND